MPQQQSIARFFGGSPALSKRKADNHEAPSKRPNTATTPEIDVKKAEIPEFKNEHNQSQIKKEPKIDYKEWEKDREEEVKESQIEEAKELIAATKDNRDVPHLDVVSDKIPYAKLTEIFETIELESSRLKITSTISRFFFEILEHSSPQKLVKVVYLFINRLGPDYEPDLELGLGETLLIKAISECYGRSTTKIKKDYHDVGDLGTVAQSSRLGQPTMFKPAALDVDTVFDTLKKIAKSTGKDSQAKKISTINRMLTACNSKSNEAKYIIRSLEGKLRIGLAEKTVLTGLAQSFINFEMKKTGKKVNPEMLASAEDIFREAFSQLPNYEILITQAFEHGAFNLLKHCQITPGIPLKPMLAKPTKSISEVLDRFQGEEFTCEYKYDGERAQVHLLSNGDVRIYSRNSEDMSQRYPDLVSIVKEFLSKLGDDKPKSLILDCEAVAWDRETKKILPFQVLSTRKRKEVNEEDIKVHICLFAFDVLFYNEPLITKTFQERREVLYSQFNTIEGKFQFATAKNSNNIDELQHFLDQSVKDSCEGLMVKVLKGADSYYEPSKRSRNWLKLKKDYLAGVGDSLDLVVIGAYIGKGKRTGTYGGFLLASYNQDTGEYETTCKIGTGFSEEDLASLYTKLKPTETTQPKPYYVYDTTNSNAVPDVWFEPSTVFEVLTADLSLSPIYKAAHQEYGRGISLRFPRFIRIREDKGIEDATSSTEIADFYERQANLN
ncbi:uncharacterized protein PRCAT00003074001 [Priceomyces carsonii]|uniref:uncharacterized protein n=1 Tax=Priceomyces carsonii TaxID=28549 RepID=UPI002EDA1490|nr:unnamed protein product [Priceomyces carsonii]